MMMMVMNTALRVPTIVGSGDELIEDDDSVMADNHISIRIISNTRTNYNNLANIYLCRGLG